MKFFRSLALAAALSIGALSAVSVYAQTPLMTEKKVFELPSYTTFGGKAIALS